MARKEYETTGNNNSKNTKSTEKTHEMSDTDLEKAQAVGQAALDHINDADLDELLKGIDDVLEENAQDFVESFIQKGGQ